LSRDIEGEIFIDLINENNQFHEKSHSYILAEKAIKEMNDKLKDENVETFHLVENEGKWKATTKTYRGREIGNWAISNLDKKQQKEYFKIRDEADTYGTKEQAEENLKKLKDFEQNNKEAFEQAKQEIDALKEAEERKAEESKKQQKIFDQIAQELDKLSDKDFEKLLGLIDEKTGQSWLQDRFRDRVQSRRLFNPHISEAYRQAKADGNNRELVEAVEKLLSSPNEKEPANANTSIQEEVESLKSILEYFDGEKREHIEIQIEILLDALKSQSDFN
jgi:hypothetical protein